MTDWERVKREYASDAPIPFEGQDGPYDPNDEAATQAYLEKATYRAGWPNSRTIRKDVVLEDQREDAQSGSLGPHTKAS